MQQSPSPHSLLSPGRRQRNRSPALETSAHPVPDPQLGVGRVGDRADGRCVTGALTLAVGVGWLEPGIRLASSWSGSVVGACLLEERVEMLSVLLAQQVRSGDEPLEVPRVDAKAW